MSPCLSPNLWRWTSCEGLSLNKLADQARKDGNDSGAKQARRLSIALVSVMLMCRLSHRLSISWFPIREVFAPPVAPVDHETTIISMLYSGVGNFSPYHELTGNGEVPRYYNQFHKVAVRPLAKTSCFARGRTATLRMYHATQLPQTSTR